jgi:hypothetical protein
VTYEGTVGSEDAKLRVMLKPLTKGWVVTSEPLSPKSKLSLDCSGGLQIKVKLQGVLPNTEYTIGLNVYGADVAILGGVRRFAFHPGAQTVDGISRALINQYELGTIRTNERGRSRFGVTLPITDGTYDLQVWVVRGCPADVSAICYKSGLTFGDSDLLTAYDPAACPKTPVAFVVTGCPRSGTGFTSHLLSLLRFPCGHEKVFTESGRGDSIELLQPGRHIWGDSSWTAAPMLNRLPTNTLVFHQVRNPVKVVRSLMGLDFFTPRGESLSKLIWCHVPQIAPEEPRLAQCMKFWTYWNRLVEREGSSAKLRYHRYRLEDLSRLETGALPRIVGLLGQTYEPETYHRALEAIPTNYNTRPRRGRDPAIKWSSLPDGELKDGLLDLALKYGYTREELEEA